MIKCIRFFLALALLVSSGEGRDEDSIIYMGSEGLLGESQFFTFRSIKDGDALVVRDLVNQCTFKEGLPTSPRWANTLIDRQEEGNYYSGLVIENRGTPIAVLGLGRMDIFNRELNADIIDAYISFGVIEFKDPKAKYLKDTIKRVNNLGIGTFCPIVPQYLGEEETKDILRLAIDTFRFLKKSSKLLHEEKTEPRCLVGLFHPGDPLIPYLKAVGFTILKKEGFFSYYAQPRIMAYFDLASTSVESKEESVTAGESHALNFYSISNHDILPIIGALGQYAGGERGQSIPFNFLERMGHQKSNAHHAFVIEDETGPIAALGVGQLNILKLDPNCKKIINAYVRLGFIRFKESDGESKIELVDGQGIGALFPVVAPSLGDEKIRNILSMGIQIFQNVKESGRLLAGNIALAHIVGLFTPEDPLIPHLRAVGFNILPDEFQDQGGKPYIMAHFKAPTDSK